MAFDLDHDLRRRGDPPLARAVSPQAAHEFQLLAIAAACKNLDDRDICKKFGLEPGYINRLFRSVSGRAFVAWFHQLPAEVQESFRPEEDFQTPPEEATPKRPEVLQGPPILDPDGRSGDPLADFLRDGEDPD